MTDEPDAPTRLEWKLDAGIVSVRLVRPARKNPLTFEVYAELRERFRVL